MIKKLVIFAILYILSFILMTFILFGWNAFGGHQTTNLLQKIITFFYSFPGRMKIFSDFDIIFVLMINTAFWSLISYLLLLTWYKLK